MNFETFDKPNLYDHLDRFSPKIESPDIIPASFLSSYDSSKPSSTPIPFSTLCFISQNINKGNINTHSLLNSFLPWSSAISSNVTPTNPSLTADIVMVQEPWWGRISIDTTTNRDIIGTVNHKEWTRILPSITDPYLDVVTYVRNNIGLGFRFSPQPDLCNSPSVLIVELQHANGSLFIINIYNPSDSSALIPLLDLQVLSTHPCVISGDFNLHHLLWSLDSTDLKSTPTADILVDLLTNLGFTILNHKGVTTFFRKEYQSVLDLTWTSPDVHIQDWEVAYHRHTGSDHYPITWTLNVSPIVEDTPNVSYAFCETNKDQWFERFLSIMDDHWDFDAEINTVEDLELAITTYVSILTQASNLARSRKHKNPHPTRWQNKDTQAALKAMRKDRN